MAQSSTVHYFAVILDLKFMPEVLLWNAASCCGE